MTYHWSLVWFNLVLFQFITCCSVKLRKVHYFLGLVSLYVGLQNSFLFLVATLHDIISRSLGRCYFNLIVKKCVMKLYVVIM